jgi:hypothetical protein
MRRAREQLERNARRAGISRRRFLLSAAGSATVLSVLAACSQESAKSKGESPGGTFSTTTESTVEPEAAAEVVGGDEFIFDVQGHLLEFPPGDDPAGVPGFPQTSCGDPDRPADCYDTEHFLDLMLLESDTSIVMLSAVPFGGELLSPDVMAEAIDTASALGCDGRVLMQGQSNPSVGSISAVKDSMSDLAGRLPVRAWKVYTHAGGPGWFLDDHDPDVPQVGNEFLDHAVELGVPIVAVHKGLADERNYSSPIDIGPAAAAHPDVSLVVYHSGYESGRPEGPYDPDAPSGTNRLIASLESSGIGPGGNVYAELGTTWRTVMGDPDQAAHLVGKLLIAVGEDNLVWGTDSIWYGSPQDQIEAFRAFQITPEFQERFGYPALTDELKAKVLGLNSARLYGVEPVTVPCEFTRDELAELRQETGVRNQLLGPRTARQVDALQSVPEPWQG